MKLSEFRKLIAEEIRYVLAAKSTVRNFNKSLNEAGSKLSTEQTYLSVLMEYLLDEFDEDAYDMLSNRIAKRLKNDEWRYEDMNNNNILQVKEILKKFYAQKKVINDKLLKKPGKKWQELIDAYLWLNA